MSHSQLCAGVLALHENKRDYINCNWGEKIAIGSEPTVAGEYVFFFSKSCLSAHGDVHLSRPGTVTCLL